MKLLMVLILAAFSTNIFSQKTTYSKYEERMIQYANNGWLFATVYDSLEIAQKSLDSCWKFIDQYPNSFAKSNVLTYMLESTVILTDDMDKINPLIDSVLTYDKLASTRLRMGEILIERNLDLQRGRDYVVDAFPKLTVKNHKFRAFLLMARSDISLGKYTSAQNNYEKAIELKPGRVLVLYEYLSFLKMSEFHQRAQEVTSLIEELEDKAAESFFEKSTNSSNINKNINDISVFDLDSSVVALDKYNGKTIVLNRFNFYCPACIKEFPILRKMITEFPEVEFIFIYSGISIKELKEIYLARKQFSFLKEQTVLFVSKNYYDKIYGYSVPHTLVIDKKGKIRYDYVGYNDDLENLLRMNLSKLSKE
ncbi:MAG: TlpA family protein disulfide reductase [Ignavibacteriae bacterium]|nr:TlpA family protein disulfide reductase [Ignavibacteriota bacterium]NOG99997.1 TlpA family protein disulfide reductase [Ignavibacteriota bacterium]